MSDSPNLTLPYMQPAQAQKHVTHNHALERLDALVQLSVEAFDVATPPDTPVEGEVWGIGPGAGGPWGGRGGQLAYFTNGAWLYLEPREGMRAWNKAASALWVRRGGAWRPLQSGDPANPNNLNNLEGLGVNSPYDAENRVSVSSPATLLSHEGAGHQLKINKAEAGDTASLLYQTGFSGRAEMGLAGADDFVVKVSADGSAWTTALSIDASSGNAALGAVSIASLDGEAVQQGPDDTTPGRLMRADYGYGPGNLLGIVSETGGAPTGAVIESGTNVNGSYTRFADGLQICQFYLTFSGPSMARGSGYVSPEDTVWVFPAAFSGVPVVSAVQTAKGEAWLIGPTTWPSDRAAIYRGRAAAFVASGSAVFFDIQAVGRWF